MENNEKIEFVNNVKGNKKGLLPIALGAVGGIIGAACIGVIGAKKIFSKKNVKTKEIEEAVIINSEDSNKESK